MQNIDSRYFPRLRSGHTDPRRIQKTVNGVPTLVCSAEGCDGAKKHRFIHSTEATEEWAKDRGLIPDVDVKIN